MIPLILVLVVAAGAGAAFAVFPGRTKNAVLTGNLSVPSAGITAAKIDINAGAGNLRIDPLSSGEPLLVSGTVQYSEKQGAPTQSLNHANDQAVFSLKANPGTRPWLALPWAACNGATEWKLLLSPGVALDLTAHSDGGNIALNLAGLTLTRVQADTGGGNIELILPDTVANVTAKTGAGNVTVNIPAGVSARITATTGLGKALIDPRFSKIDEHTYQSPDYDTAAKKVELTLQSGAGNIVVNPK